MIRVHAAMEDELLILTGANGAWRAETALEGRSPSCLAFDPLLPELVYCGTPGRGIWRSTDAGESWNVVGAETLPGPVSAVAVSPNERAGQRGVVYAGTEPAGLYRSEDGGETWRELEGMRELPSRVEWSFPPRPDSNHVRAISCDPNSEGRVYVAVEAGALVRSPDAGETWHDRAPDGPLDTHTLLTHAAAPDRVYSAAGDGVMHTGLGYSESPDGGETWERFPAGLQEHYLWGMALDPADPDTMVISAAPGPMQAHSPTRARSTIYRREAGGPWREVTDGLPERDGRVAAILASNPWEPGVFYVLTGAGLHRSVDAGLGWEPLEVSWPERYLRQRPRDLAVVQAG